MDHQRPPSYYSQLYLPDPTPIPPPYARFSIWKRLLVCSAVAAFVGLFFGIKAVTEDKQLVDKFTPPLLFGLLTGGIGALGGLLWFGADYLEHRDQQGLRTSPLFAHFFCMGLTSAMLWAFILFPLILIASIVLAFLGML